MIRKIHLRLALLASVALCGPAQSDGMMTQIDICIVSSLRALPTADIAARANYVRDCVADPGATRDLVILSFIAGCLAEDASDPASIVACARDRQSDAHERESGAPS